jgi:hypothetical protein
VLTVHQIRREKNREAQQVFRKRRQAAEAAQGRRTQRLEAVVEEMSCIFIGFFDEMVQTAGVAEQHPDLIKSLRRSLVRVLALANDVVDMDEERAAATLAASSPVAAPDVTTVAQLQHEDDNCSSAHGTTNKVDVATIMPESGPSSAWDSWSQSQAQQPLSHHIQLRHYQQYSQPTPVDTCGAEGIGIVPYYFSPGSDSLSDPPPSLFPDSGSSGSADPVSGHLPASSSSSASPSLTALNVFGNGWTPLNLPPSILEELPKLPSRSLQNDLSALDTFTLRLIERSVANGYFMLHNNPAAISHPSFRLSRLFRTPEQLTTSFRWLLGPGREFMHRASGATWGKDGGTVAALPGRLVDARASAGVDVGECTNPDLVDVPDCLTAIGIQAELESLGAKMIDSETMEVCLSQSELSGDSDSGVGVVSDTQSPDINMNDESALSAWTYFDFFSMRRPEPPRQTLRMNVSALVKNLAAVAICFARGPGYPRQQLLSIMKASTCVS